MRTLYGREGGIAYRKSSIGEEYDINRFLAQLRDHGDRYEDEESLEMQLGEDARYLKIDSSSHTIEVYASGEENAVIELTYEDGSGRTREKIDEVWRKRVGSSLLKALEPGEVSVNEILEDLTMRQISINKSGEEHVGVGD